MWLRRSGFERDDPGEILRPRLLPGDVVRRPGGERLVGDLERCSVWGSNRDLELVCGVGGKLDLLGDGVGTTKISSEEGGAWLCQNNLFCVGIVFLMKLPVGH